MLVYALITVTVIKTLSRVHYSITKRRHFGLFVWHKRHFNNVLMFSSCYLEAEILLRHSGKIYFRAIAISQALLDKQKNVEDAR